MTISLEHLTETFLIIFLSVFLSLKIAQNFLLFFYFYLAFCGFANCKFYSTGIFFLNSVLSCCMRSGDDYGSCSSTFRHAINPLVVFSMAGWLTDCMHYFKPLKRLQGEASSLQFLRIDFCEAVCQDS